jgi:hypothetical protein
LKNPRKDQPAAPALPNQPSPYMPDARECALILLALIRAKEKDSDKAFTRFRIADLTLRKIWGRNRFTLKFIADVNEWLSRADRVLFFAGGVYGVMPISSVESWARVSSKSLGGDVETIMSGAYDFRSLENLLVKKRDESDEGD